MHIVVYYTIEFDTAEINGLVTFHRKYRKGLCIWSGEFSLHFVSGGEHEYSVFVGHPLCFPLECW